jgi:putative tryptophan/tyrosine transport system substrate-binding protein
VGAEEIIGKQLELLTQTVPNVSRVALLRDPTHPFAAATAREAERAARASRLHLQTIDVRSPDDFEKAFAIIKADRTDAILVPLRMLLSYRDRLTLITAKH